MKPFFDGQRAFKNPRFNRGPNGGLLIEPNPHKEGTKKHQDWETGYNKAYRENLEELRKQAGGGSQEV